MTSNFFLQFATFSLFFLPFLPPLLPLPSVVSYTHKGTTPPAHATRPAPIMAGMPTPNMAVLLPHNHNHHHQQHALPFEQQQQQQQQQQPVATSAPLLSMMKRAEETDPAEAEVLRKLRQSSARLGAVVPPAHSLNGGGNATTARSAPIDIVRLGPDGEPFDASALRYPSNLKHHGRHTLTHGRRHRKAHTSSSSSSGGSSSGGSSSS